MLFVNKYSPKKLDEILGNPEKIILIRQWILQWMSGKKRKAMLIHGPSGVGKTSVAYALKQEYDLEVIELNASELRNKGRVERITGGATLAGSLFGSLRLILIDDADILAGRADSGGGTAITNFLAESPCPIIVTASDIWDKKMTQIRNECEVIDFKKVSKVSIRKILERVTSEEKLDVAKEMLDAIAENVNGDVRAALNDLQARRTTNRDQEKDIFEMVRRIFKAEKYSTVKDSLKGDIDYDILKLWIDENIPAEYETREDIAAAYDSLSRADIFDGRIRKSHWQYLKYSIDLATAGVAVAKKSVYKKFTRYNFPSYLKSMSRTISTRAMRKGIGLKIGARVHANRREALEYLHLIKDEAKKNSDAVLLYYDFSEEELAYVLGTSVSKIKKV